MSFELFVLELAPYFMATAIILLFFIYLIFRMFLMPKRQKHVQKQIAGNEIEILEEMMDRLTVLNQRIKNLEEIIDSEKQ